MRTAPHAALWAVLFALPSLAQLPAGFAPGTQFRKSDTAPASCTLHQLWYDTSSDRAWKECTTAGTPGTWTVIAGDASATPSAGSVGDVQCSGGDGTFTTCGFTASGGNVTVPGTLSTGDGTAVGEAKLWELLVNGDHYFSWIGQESRATTLKALVPTADPTAGQSMVFGAPSSTVSTVTWAMKLTDPGSNGLVNRTSSGVTAVAVAGTGGDYYGPGAAPHSIGCVFDGGGSAVAADSKCYARAEYACAVTGWTIEAVGSSPTTTIDVWEIATGTALPTVANTITASAKPALATGNALASTTLTGWDTAIAANSIVGFNVDAIANATWIAIKLKCQ